MNIKVAAVLFTSKKMKNGEHPIMIRLSKLKSRKYISTGFTAKPNQWNSEKEIPRSNHPEQNFIQAYISKVKFDLTHKIAEYKSQNKPLTIEALIISEDTKPRYMTVFEYFDKVISEMTSISKIGNGKVYKEAMSSLLQCFSTKQLEFCDIDYAALNKYANFLIKRGSSSNTINLRIRTFRALYNRAINEGYADANHYPFKKFKISQFKTESHPRAVSIEEIRKIENIELDENLSIFKSRHYFMVSYYGAGINFSDIAKLKWKNIINNRIEYVRSKTGKKITFTILAPLQKIIDYWKSKTFDTNEDYIFPILDRKIHKTASQINNRIHKVITFTNRDLKEIGDSIKCSIPLTTYVARHSFATVLMRNKVSSRIIGDILGHHDEKTTEIYLAKFDHHVYDDAMQNLCL